MTDTVKACAKCRYWRRDFSTENLGACWQGNPAGSKEHRAPPAKTPAEYSCDAFELYAGRRLGDPAPK